LKYVKNLNSMKYKQSGIYCYRNVINNKKYVGQSIDLLERKRDFYGRNGMYSGIIFQNAIEKYGKENFEYSILTHCKPEELNFFEKFYIARLKTTDRRYGYNSTTGGDSYKLTEECRKHMIESWTDERRRIQSELNLGEKNHFYGRKHTLEARKLVAANTRKCAEKRFFEKNGFELKDLKMVVEKYILEHPNASYLEMARLYKVRPEKISSICNELGYTTEKVITLKRETEKKPVVQCNRENHSIILNIFSSISDVSKITNMKNTSGISACVNGRQSHAYGYYWRFTKEDEKPYEKLNEEFFTETESHKKLDEEVKRRLKERGVYDKTYRYKTVYCYGKDGELEKVYPSVKSVGLDGFVPCDVCNCCNGKIKTNKGFTFSYTELSKEDAANRFINTKKKPVIQMTKEGTVVDVWDCATTASKKLELPLSNISACCYGKAKTCGGYTWRFVN